MSKVLTRASSFIPYLPMDVLEVPEPPKDSFFYQVFNANLETAKKVVNTSYLQKMKVGALSPDNYGCLTVLDSYYCYRAADTLKSLICKIDRNTEEELYTITKSMMTGYDSYNKTFLADWHIRESDSVTPTETMRNYSEHEQIVMCYEEPIYTLVAYIPCYYLWPWFSQQIQNDSGYQPGVYKDWFEGNYDGTDASFNSAWKIGVFIEEWIKAGKPFDKSKATEIYTKSMQYELQVFTEADRKSE